MNYEQALSIFEGVKTDTSLMVPETSYKKIRINQTRIAEQCWEWARQKYRSLPLYQDLQVKPVVMKGIVTRVSAHDHAVRGRKVLARYLKRYKRTGFLCRYARDDEGPLNKELRLAWSTRSYVSDWHRVAPNREVLVLNGSMISIDDMNVRKLNTLRRLNYLQEIVMETEQEYISAADGIRAVIESPADLRRQLLSCISGVLEGKVSVPQANAIAGASAEVHKSIRQEWDMRIYATENACLSAPVDNEDTNS